MKKYILILTALIVSSSMLSAQFYNDGALVTIQPGALVHIQGDFINQGGEITNSGLIELGGNWENTVMTFPMTPGSGVVNLVGGSQIIGGEFPTLFHELNLSSDPELILRSNISIGDQVNLNNGSILLNQNILHLLNALPEAISSDAGGVIAETADVYGYVRWDMGEVASNSYSIPFITGTDGTGIPLDYELVSSGSGEMGYLLFTTYGTENDNRPLPLGVSDIEINSDDTGLAIVDRYWVICDVDYTTPPEGSTSFSYDNEVGGSNEIVTENLVVIYWDEVEGWRAFEESTSANNVISAAIGQNYSSYALWSGEVSSTVELDVITAFSLYPNPTSDQLTVKLSSKISEPVMFYVIDQLGRTVQKRPLDLIRGDVEVVLDVSDQPSGFYTLNVVGDSVLSIRSFSIVD